MSTAKKTRPIYRKPDREMVPATADNFRALFERLAEPDPVGRMLADWRTPLVKLLEDEGLRIDGSISVDEADARFRRRLGARSVDGGTVWYREADISPAALEAIDALAAMGEVRRLEGDRRVLAAVDLGAALERLRATVAFAPSIHAGQAVRQGGRVGAARAHGPHAERMAERERWRARFAVLRKKFPEAPKKTLLGMIEAETGETFRTLRRYIRQR